MSYQPPLRINLIDRDNVIGVIFFYKSQDLFVIRNKSAFAVRHHKHKVSAFNDIFYGIHNLCFYKVFAVKQNSARVHKRKLFSKPFGIAVKPVAGYPRIIVNYGLLLVD